MSQIVVAIWIKIQEHMDADVLDPKSFLGSLLVRSSICFGGGFAIWLTCTDK